MKMDFANFFKILSAWPGFAAAVKAIEAIIQAGLEALVTKTDLTASTSELRGEMNELRGEMKAMAAELRGEISAAVNKMLLAQLAIAWVAVCCAMDFGGRRLQNRPSRPTAPPTHAFGSKRREGPPAAILRPFFSHLSPPVVLPDPPGFYLKRGLLPTPICRSGVLSQDPQAPLHVALLHGSGWRWNSPFPKR